jgi:hypothetical protein
VISTPRGFDLLGMRPPRDWTGPNFNGPPFSARPNTLGANDDCDGFWTMLVFTDILGHAAWHNAWHPVWRYPCSGEFCHADGHAPAAEMVWEPRDNRGDDFGVRMGVAAQLVSTTINGGAQRCALDKDIFQSEAAGFSIACFRLG